MFRQAVRRFTTSAIRASHYEEGPGKNLPFSVENKWRLLGMMVVFFGSGFAFPFIVVRHQLLKNSQQGAFISQNLPASRREGRLNTKEPSGWGPSCSGDDL
ncbi:hypothetical protein JZ751_001063 [Albula glossodonta]|uniref:Cytochrome c oxidase subunit 7C, mitochondrial n=1 Tax=Albula glossodonta TaxID=121402 RepID=A0A8T2PSG5_9TELE|nr:hypothetical protein JZ751_001063 [Albula glossodonta]